MSALDDALALAARWCAIPSHAGDPAAQMRQAGDLRAWLSGELGAVLLSPAPSAADPAPVIHARIDGGASRTVLLYNMYDVMPATAEGWLHDPWTGGISEMPGIGRVFVARGAENNKGPLAGMLVALRDLKRLGRLRVNVEILLDGQEERASPALRRWLAARDCPLRPAAGALFPSFCEYGGGPPRLYLGFSGMAKGRLEVRAGRWGGPARAVHSSNAPWIANPARVLVDALARIGGPETGELARIEPDADAARLIAALARDFDPEAELRFRNAARFARPRQGCLDPEALLRHVLTTASFNIAALVTDPIAGDAVIPAAAAADFDLRSPPGLAPDALVVGIRDMLATEPAFVGAALQVADSYPGARVVEQAAGVRALRDAYAQGPAPQVWPWAIGAAPAYAFGPHAESFLIGGAGRGGNAHGVNEFLQIEGFGRFIASVSHWIEGMAA
ncbi:M20/M25/M40 family metallo-hydrolase [uncultured Paracoccus sp.]|uniref:M20 family metallopeptidase n=1 Tax=uncultured Paracoccus sp. TaxID=189685 RepID=UPI0025F0FC38|nr:M20/M25/M40 family metallo-hydrolase [uncultured Paracoccus sp.]